MDINDIGFLDDLANQAVVKAEAPGNLTWRVEWERLAGASRALANATRRATVHEGGDGP